MTYATDTFDGDGSTVEFTLTFDYIQRDHVTVYRIDNSDQAETELTVIASGDPSGDQYVWETDKKIKVGTAPTDEQKLRIERDTPEDQQLVQWKDGSYIIANDLNTSDLQWLYGLQELEDKYDSISSTAIKYLGAIDLTVDEAPAEPTGGDFYINTGDGTVVDSWTGIAGDDVVGSEQVVYSTEDAEWQIFQVPSSQTGVIEVNVSAPITRDVTDPQRPIIGINPAKADADGSMSAGDKAKLDALPDADTGINLGYTAAANQGTVTNTAGTDAVIPAATPTNVGLINEAAAPVSGTVQFARQVTDTGAASWAEVDIPPGTIVDDTEPTSPDDGQLWFNTDNNVLWVWDEDNSTWNPAMEPSPTGGGEDYANGVINQKAIFENVATIDEDYTISDNHNALSAGPITIADGTTVTVGDDETWTVVGSTNGVDPAGFWDRDDTTLSPANSGDRVTVGNAPADGNGVTLYSNGGFLIRKDAAGAAIEVFSGGSTNNDRTFLVDENGSVFIDNTSSSDSAFAVEGVNNDDRAGRATFKARNEAGGELFNGTNADGSADVFVVRSDGSVAIGGNDAAHTIDEYEEGEWTPSIDKGTATISDATYVRVGRLVTVYALFASFSNQSDTSSIKITGIPFASSRSQAAGSMVGRYLDRDAYSTYVSGADVLECYAITSGTWAPLHYEHINSNSSTFYITATYETNE